MLLRQIKILSVEEKAIFIPVILGTIASVILSIYFRNLLLLSIPFAILLIATLLINYKILYFLMIFFLPVSVPYVFAGGHTISVLSEVLMLATAAAFIIDITGKAGLEKDFLKHPFIILIILQIVWSIFPVLFSVSYLPSVKFFISKLLYIVVCVFLTAHIIKDYKDLIKIIWCYSCGLLTGVLYTLVIHARSSFSFESVNNATALLFQNHVMYATSAALTLPLIWVIRRFYSKGTFIFLFLTLSRYILLFAIITSYTRSSWLTLVLICIMFYIIENRVLKITLAISTVVIIFGIIYVVKDNKFIDFSTDYKKAIFHKGNIEGHLRATYKLEDVSGMERLYRWAAAYNMIKENPFLGTGPSTYYPEYKKYTINSFNTYVSDNPEKSTTHNYFLMTLTEQGIPGLILLCTLVIMVLIRGSAIYHRSENPEYKNLTLAFLLCFFAVIPPLFFSDFLETDKVGAIFYISVAALAKVDLWKEKSLIKN